MTKSVPILRDLPLLVHSAGVTSGQNGPLGTILLHGRKNPEGLTLPATVQVSLPSEAVVQLMPLIPVGSKAVITLSLELDTETETDDEDQGNVVALTGIDGGKTSDDLPCDTEPTDDKEPA